MYRASGVLPRQAGANLAYTKEQWRDKMVAELPPMELSLHVLATQPLVRDYRADPLGARATDKVTRRVIVLWGTLNAIILIDRTMRTRRVCCVVGWAYLSTVCGGSPIS